MKMDKDELLKQTIESICNGSSETALISCDSDGSLNLVTEKKSEFSFTVCDDSTGFEVLLNKLKELGYTIDLNTFRGIIAIRCVIKVDVANKRVTRPCVVSAYHYLFLQKIDSILITDVINSFEELVINQNKKLADSLRQKDPEAQAYIDSHHRSS